VTAQFSHRQARPIRFHAHCRDALWFSTRFLASDLRWSRPPRGRVSGAKIGPFDWPCKPVSNLIAGVHADVVTQEDTASTGFRLRADGPRRCLRCRGDRTTWQSDAEHGGGPAATTANRRRRPTNGSLFRQLLCPASADNACVRAEPQHRRPVRPDALRHFDTIGKNIDLNPGRRHWPLADCLAVNFFVNSYSRRVAVGRTTAAVAKWRNSREL